MLIEAAVRTTKRSAMKADPELIQQCQQGDKQAFEQLVKSYERKVFGLVYQITRSSNEVEDIAQEVFTKIYFSLPQFRLDASFDAWLYRIVVNQCCDHLRKRKRTAQVLESELGEEDSDYFENLTAAASPRVPGIDKQMEMQQLAAELLGYLPPEERSLLILKEIEDLSILELAKVFKTTQSAVKLRLFRARNHVRKEHDRRLKGRR
jgi:RNA polymerase sigma-70 factor (ECF subfamily)